MIFGKNKLIIKLRNVIETQNKIVNEVDKVNKELIARRDEVVSRAKNLANRTFPDWLIEKPMDEWFKWMIDPHLTEVYDIYKQVKPEQDRGAERAVMKIMEMKEKLDDRK